MNSACGQSYKHSTIINYDSYCIISNFPVNMSLGRAFIISAIDDSIIWLKYLCSINLFVKTDSVALKQHGLIWGA